MCRREASENAGGGYAKCYAGRYAKYCLAGRGASIRRVVAGDASPVDICDEVTTTGLR